MFFKKKKGHRTILDYPTDFYNHFVWFQLVWLFFKKAKTPCSLSQSKHKNGEKDQETMNFFKNTQVIYFRLTTTLISLSVNILNISIKRYDHIGLKMQGLI